MRDTRWAWGFRGTEYVASDIPSMDGRESGSVNSCEPLFSLAKVLSLWVAALQRACLPPSWKHRWRHEGGEGTGDASEIGGDSSSWRPPQGRERHFQYSTSFAYGDAPTTARACNLGGSQSSQEYNLGVMQEAVFPVAFSLLLVGSVCLAFPPPVALAALAISLMASQGTPLGFRLASLAACIAGGASGLMLVAALNVVARLPGCRDVQVPVGVLGFALVLGPWLKVTMGVASMAPVVVALQTATFVQEA